MKFYTAMQGALGPSNWWPADSPFEVVVGAVLTQNTAWTQAAKAIANMQNAGALSASALHAMPQDQLEALIRPAGHFRVKAKRLKNLLEYLERACGFDLDALAKQGMAALRRELLAVNGVGPETADSILLYALNLPSFVVDAYTMRLLSRHHMAHEGMDYEETRDFFMDVLDPDPALYNEFHALIVRVGHLYCKPRAPKCDQCPLGFSL